MLFERNFLKLTKYIGLTKVHNFLYLSFVGQLRDRMWKRFILRTIELDGQLLLTNYHFVIVKLFGMLTLTTISSWTGLKNKHFQYFSDNNVNWNDRFTVTLRSNCGVVYHSKVHWVCTTPALAMDYAEAPWTRKGHHQIQILGNDRRPLLLSLLEATAGYLHTDVLLSARRYCYSRVNVLNKQ